MVSRTKGFCLVASSMKGGLLDLTFVPAKDAAPQTLFSLLSGQKVHTRFFPKLSVFCFKLWVDRQGYCEGVPLGGCARGAGGGVGLAAQALAGEGQDQGEGLGGGLGRVGGDGNQTVRGKGSWKSDGPSKVAFHSGFSTYFS